MESILIQDDHQTSEHLVAIEDTVFETENWSDKIFHIKVKKAKEMIFHKIFFIKKLPGKWLKKVVKTISASEKWMKTVEASEKFYK